MRLLSDSKVVGGLVRVLVYECAQGSQIDKYAQSWQINERA